MFSFVTRNAARLYAVAAALLALGAHYLPSLPVGLVLAAVAALLGLSVDAVTVPTATHDEAVREALYTPVPDSE
ncbi:hypothetical protein ACFY2K_26205 [Kitasatospora sp. NPDC001309]|uniref:hypothetical protein n=1 Tax=Kitasatospora sp. NPDC001309 TaxID=3364013 RepID=UPI0036895A7B